MPTLQDVARKAGVSTATVSKVLSNTPYFTEETREKVIKAVEELGYVPNLAARALATGKTQIIAVVFPYVYEAFFTDPLTLRILEGIEHECNQHEYNMLLSAPRISNNGPDENYLKLISSGYIDGVIAIDNVPKASVLEPIDRKRIACVAVGYHPANYFVRSDDLIGGEQLMEHILSQGHKHIGIITVPKGLNFSINYRLEGLRNTAQAKGLDFDQFVVAFGDFSTSSGVEAVETLLNQHPEVTAIICLNDRMAMGALQQAQALGRRVPDDLAIVGYDNIPAAAMTNPPLTTIDQQAPEIGRQAGQMLFAILDGQMPESQQLPPRLIVRQSSSKQ